MCSMHSIFLSSIGNLEQGTRLPIPKVREEIWHSMSGQGKIRYFILSEGKVNIVHVVYVTMVTIEGEQLEHSSHDASIWILLALLNWNIW